MKYKKLLALVLTAGMLGGILSGCMPGSGTGEAAKFGACSGKQTGNDGRQYRTGGRFFRKCRRLFLAVM